MIPRAHRLRRRCRCIPSRSLRSRRGERISPVRRRHAADRARRSCRSSRSRIDDRDALARVVHEAVRLGGRTRRRSGCHASIGLGAMTRRRAHRNRARWRCCGDRIWACRTIGARGCPRRRGACRITRGALRSTGAARGAAAVGARTLGGSCASRAIDDLRLVALGTAGVRRSADVRRLGRPTRRCAAARRLAGFATVIGPVIVVMVMIGDDRQSVRVIAVVTDAAPVPTGSVEADAPRVRCPRVVVVPTHDQRTGRTPVVRPTAVHIAVEDEVAVDVVVPATAPVHARERVECLGIRVHVRDDLDARAVGHRVVADDLSRRCGSARGRRRGDDALDVRRVGDVHVLVRAGLRDHRARCARAVVGAITCASDQAQADEHRGERGGPERSERQTELVRRHFFTSLLPGRICRNLHSRQASQERCVDTCACSAR